VFNGSSRIVVDGVPDVYRMPPFRTRLSDQEIADVVTFIRGGWGNRAGAANARDVAAATPRKEGLPISQPSVRFDDCRLPPYSQTRPSGRK